MHFAKTLSCLTWFTRDVITPYAGGHCGLFLLRKLNPVVLNTCCRRFILSASHVFDRHKVLLLGAAPWGRHEPLVPQKRAFWQERFWKQSSFRWQAFWSVPNIRDRGTLTREYACKSSPFPTFLFSLLLQRILFILEGLLCLGGWFDKYICVSC